jgi:2-C-methyl-D-erythritol 4-phosphate cytidylyltransferase
VTTGCVLVAAGAGTRLAAGAPKAFVALEGRPLLVHAAERVLASGVVDEVVAVVPRDRLAECGALLAHLPGAVSAVAGGATRQESVRAGLAALPAAVDVVLVHDAARCLAPPALVAAVVAAVRSGHDAVVPGVPVHDTVRTLGTAAAPGGVVDRSLLRAVQTPQGFARAVLDAAHAAAAAGSPAALAATDDATLVELAGTPVHVVPGAEEAFKVTRPLDLALAAAVLARPVAP